MESVIAFGNENLIVLCVITVAILVISIVYQTKTRRRKELVGYVSALNVFPVKSCKGMPLNSAEVTNLGIKHDRQFVLVNKFGTFMTLRRYPKLVLINQKITEDKIVLQVDEMPLLKLPLFMTEGEFSREIKVFQKSAVGVHVSQEADDWFAEYLNVKGCQLFCFQLGGKPRFSDDNNGKVANYSNEKDTLMFADGCPILLMSEGTVAELNLSLDSKVDVSRFRPNIVVTKCMPHAEDKWGLIQIGETHLQGLYPCPRCVAVAVDNSTAELDKNVLPTISRVSPASDDYPILKGEAVLGFNYGVRKQGEIRVGDPVYKLT